MADSDYSEERLKAEQADESEAPGRVKSPAEYIREMRGYLRYGQQKQAYAVILQAVALYPSHPLVLSYYGMLQALVDRKFYSGIAACTRAFVGFRSADRRNAEQIYPLFYLNLGRACLAAGKKKEAVENFNKGLKHDPYHAELRKEMQRLGVRKKPVVPYLSRSNPLNRLLGILRSR